MATVIILVCICVIVASVCVFFNATTPNKTNTSATASANCGEDGLNFVGDPTEGFTDDEVRSAALKIVYGCPEGQFPELGGTVESNQRALEEVHRRRSQYVNYQPARMRRAIMGWFDYYERRVRENLNRCRTYDSEKARRESNQRAENDRLHEARVRALVEKLRESKNVKNIL